MEAAPGTMDSIVILDDDEEEGDKACPSSSSPAPSRLSASPRKSEAACPVPTHIIRSPFASNHKESHILALENQRLFLEFVEYCRAHTKDHPEVITFLETKHAKASPDFLASVELRNTLGRCLTRAQACRAKTFVYINELCTVLKQHAIKKKQAVAVAPPNEEGGSGGLQEELPSTSGTEEQKKPAKASRRQIAYLENLLKVYYEEIRRLQEQEVSLDDMMEEDSSYIQEHRLKRKMMKIYNKLCELKDCSTLTGRVIEQRVSYGGSRYPEVNRKIERFINSPEAQQNPPDYSDILRVVQRANERCGLSLSRKQVAQIAQDAFRDTGNQLQERRHLDMVYNFGCHLTDAYNPASDPALSDPALTRKLRTNRELALNNLNDIITQYAIKQDDIEEEERKKRLEKMKSETPAGGEEVTPENERKDEEDDGEGAKSDGEERENDDNEEEEEDEEESSDPDIEEELEASHSQEGADDEREEEEDDEDGTHESDKEPLGSGQSCSPEVMEMNGKEDSQSATSCQGDGNEGHQPIVKVEMESPPLMSTRQSAGVGRSSVAAGSSSASPEHAEAVSPSPCLEACLPSSCMDNESTSCSPLTRNVDSLPPSPAADLSNRDSPVLACDSRSANCSPLSPSLQTDVNPPISKKRKMTESSTKAALNGDHKRARSDSDDDIPLDMGVVTSSPLQADSTLTDSPTQELVSSSQFSPSPKNKVHVGTQCDPVEVIVLSDSE